MKIKLNNKTKKKSRARYIRMLVVCDRKYHYEKYTVLSSLPNRIVLLSDLDNQIYVCDPITEELFQRKLETAYQTL